MLREIRPLLGFSVEAMDGDIGSVRDFLFQANNWEVRYLVVDTGNFLSGRNVLIIPEALGKPQEDSEVFPVQLTREQIENSPDMDWAEPVSKEMEENLRLYFGLRFYSIPRQAEVALFPKSISEQEEAQEKPDSDESNIRSLDEVEEYSIHATDGKVGHVDDFLVDDDAWMIRYMTVETGNWLSGKTVLISPKWIDGVSWVRREIDVELSREAIENSPEYDPSSPVDREYEARLHEHYGVPKYWS